MLPSLGVPYQFSNITVNYFYTFYVCVCRYEYNALFFFVLFFWLAKMRGKICTFAQENAVHTMSHRHGVYLAGNKEVSWVKLHLSLFPTESLPPYACINYLKLNNKSNIIFRDDTIFFLCTSFNGWFWRGQITLQ